MIELIELCKYYGEKAAVDHVSLRVERGNNMVLLGTSGCGKTTTLKMINRLIEPSSGTIRVNGQDVRQQPLEKLRRNIGYVIQSIGLFPHYTVAQNIGLVPSLLKWPEKRIRERCSELMNLVGLDETMGERMPYELSGGQQQRVGLARALAADPEVILMDEPFGALDPITKQQILTEFLQMEALLSKTMIMVTHDVFEAVTLADSICLMDQGRVQQIGSPLDLVFRPASNFVRDFFNIQRFRLELQVLRLEDILPLAETEEATGGEREPTSQLNSSDSLLYALEKLEQEGNENLLISGDDKKKRPSRIMSRESMLKFFYLLKKDLSAKANH
ncbi:MAG: ABC transporter ATP-binding protein [Cyclobacteriaceae bacterium]